MQSRIKSATHRSLFKKPRLTASIKHSLRDNIRCPFLNEFCCEDVMKQTPSSKRLLENLKSAAQGYEHVMGKKYLFVYENNYIEVVFTKKYFKHLTGIKSSLRAKDFFDASIKKKIKLNQISFDKEHPYSLCVKKLNYLASIKELLCSDLLMLHKIKTKTYFIPKGVTDLNFVLGLDVQDNINGEKLSENLVPYTLRVGDEKSFDSSLFKYQVDFVFSKKQEEKTYSELCFGDKEELIKLPSEILALIDDVFTEKLKKENNL